MKYLFHPEAEEELNLAIDYYEECRTGLGLEFANEVYKTIQRIINFPTAWQKFDNNTRRCLINRFPSWYYLLSKRETDYYSCGYAT